jgi:hypothetical protein
MADSRIDEILNLLRPKKGTRLWYGGATAAGSLRGVGCEEAAWRPAPERHSIWALVLHLAYWKYAVRRILEDSPRGVFARKPSNWPAVPAEADEAAWKKDRGLLGAEQEKLLAVVRAFGSRRLDEIAPGSGRYRYIDLMFGVATHDLYHTGQIQLVRRLYRGRRK